MFLLLFLNKLRRRIHVLNGWLIEGLFYITTKIMEIWADVDIAEQFFEIIRRIRIRKTASYPYYVIAFLISKQNQQRSQVPSLTSKLRCNDVLSPEDDRNHIRWNLWLCNIFLFLIKQKLIKLSLNFRFVIWHMKFDHEWKYLYVMFDSFIVDKYDDHILNMIKFSLLNILERSTLYFSYTLSKYFHN